MAHKLLASGTVLASRYRIERLIKSGGFAAVYVATDLRQRRVCAVKETFDPTGDNAEQFRLEAEILADIRHQNLPAVWDYFGQDGDLYLVMEYIDGEDLESHLEMSGLLSEDYVRDWVEQLCDALAMLHHHQPPIIHRDIKPANVKITPDGRAVLVDFGIAKFYQAGNNTQVAARAVTDGFSPLEQYGQGSTDARSDIYALGATVYNLLTGIIPPDAPSRITSDTLVPPSHYLPTITAVMEQLVLRALQLHPKDRYQSAEDMRWALAAVYEPRKSNRLSSTGTLPPSGNMGTGNLRQGNGGSGGLRTGDLRAGQWVCPNCGTRNAAGTGFCLQCGTHAPNGEADQPTRIIPTGALAQSGALDALDLAPTTLTPAVGRKHGWEVLAGPAGGVLLHVSGRPGQGLIACGERGLVLMNMGEGWAALPTVTSYTLHAAASATGHVWAVGDFGTVAHFTGGRWSVLPSNGDDTFVAIALDSPVSGWIAGASGALIDLRDMLLDPLAVRRGQMRAITIDDVGDGWAVGNDSLLLRLTQGGWKARTASSGFGDLWGVDHDTMGGAWAVGQNGLVVHLDNTGWQVYPALQTPTLHAVAFNRRGEAWAVGEGGALAWFNGDTWSVPAEQPTTAHLRSVAWLSDDEAWVVGDRGLVLRWHR